MKNQFIDRANKLFKKFKNEDNQQKKTEIYGRILDLMSEARRNLRQEDFKEFQDNWMFRHTLVLKNWCVSLEDLENVLKKTPIQKS